MYKKFHDFIRTYSKKDFVQDKFDGVYPFGLKDIPLTKYKSFGEKNPDKVFYVIYRTPYEAGFFSNFAHVVRHLKLIEGTSFIPVVDFQNFKTFYNVDKPINETENSWEYYFEQLSPYSLEEVYQSKNVLFCDGQYPHGVKFSESETYEYYNKAFRVKEDILKIINQYDEIFANKKVLGVHFRGKDLNIFPGHSFGVTKKQMFKYTDEIIERYGIEKIFVATDEKSYLDEYIKRYGDMVFFADNFRTEKINEFNITPRDNHRYLLGREVLVDLIMLLKCNGILHGISNIPITAKKINPDFAFAYEIDNGVNSKNKYFARYLFKIKKRLPKFLGGLLDEVNIKINKLGGVYE